MLTTKYFQLKIAVKIFLFSLLLVIVPKMASAETVGIFYDYAIAQHEFATGDIKTALELKGFTTEVLNLSSLNASYTKKKIVISLANNTTVKSLLATQGGSTVSSQGEQAYALRTTSTPLSYWIFGGDANGAMYGGLQIAENINFNSFSGTYNEQDAPYLKNRGIKFNMPMDAKAPTYFSDNDGTSHKEAIKNVWDSTFWYTWFDEMARHRYNVLSLWTNNPFTSMTNLAEYERASIQGVQGYDSNGNIIQVNNMTIQDKILYWQRIMKYGRSRGFDIYFHTWNIVLNTAKSTGYGLEESITDPETKVYVKKCMIEFLKNYPDLKGFGVTAGERMSGGDESKALWMWDTYGSAMLEYAKANPSRELVFIHRQHDGNVDLMMQNFKPLNDQANVRLDISFKYSQAHAHAAVAPPFIDDRNIIPLAQKYNLKTWLTVRNDDFYYLPWADPQFVRDYVNNIPEVGTTIESIYIGADGWTFSREWASKDPYYKNKNALSIQKTWMMQKVWGRIAYNPNVSNDLFKNHLNLKYPEVSSNNLFQAWTDASKALKLANEQVTGDSRDLDMEWWPEGWTSLDGFLSLANTNDAQPMSGSNLCSFANTASGSCSGKISAWDNATQIETLASGALGIVSALNAGSNTELGLNLKDIKAMSYLGLYNAYKFKAAIYSKQGKTNEARDAIGSAYCNWKSYTDLMDELYTGATMQRNHSFATWHDHDVDALKDYTDLGGIGLPSCVDQIVTGVSLSGCPASALAIGGTQQLTATVAPSNATNKSVTWSSSNTAVATVDANGLVTGKAAGNASITVTTVDQGKTATCAVTVANIPVTSVSVAPTTLSIGVGATGQLTPTVLPTNATNKNVTWVSNNTAVATVDANGLVTGKVAGNATITVTTVDQGKTATCAVTVANIPVTSVSVAPTTLSIGVGATGQLTPTVLPANATNKNVTWLSSNTTVATVVNGLVTAKAQGTANITVTTVNGGKTATCAVTVTTIPTDALPWNEAFTYANGTTSHGSPTTWTATNMSVQNNEISFNSTTAGVFTTGPINISSGAVTVSVKVRGGTGLDLGQDYLKLYKKVDGGAEVQIAAADGLLAATTWSVDITSGSRVELVLRAYVSATAEYYYFDDLKVVSKTAPVTYTINATAGANGTISPSGSVSVSTGASQTFNFTPASAYIVDVVTVNGSAVTPTTSTSHTISNVTANQTINVTFKLALTTADVTALTEWKLGTTNTKVAGSNRMMVVMVSGESSTTFKANAVTYGGQTMTLLTEKSLAGGGSTIYSGVFVLYETGVNAATSGTINVTWSATPSAGSTTYSVLLANVDQTATITKYTKAASSVTSITATSILAPAGSMAIMCGTTASNNTITANNSYTKQFESNSTWGDAVGASKKGTGVNETAKYTQSASSNMVICSFVVAQAPVLKSATIAANDNKTVEDAVFIYPNPVTNTIYIDHAENATIQIFNSLGQLIYNKSVLGVKTKIDVEELNVKGLMMVKVISNQKISVHKVIVK